VDGGYSDGPERLPCCFPAQVDRWKQDSERGELWSGVVAIVTVIRAIVVSTIPISLPLNVSVFRPFVKLSWALPPILGRSRCDHLFR